MSKELQNFFENSEVVQELNEVRKKTLSSIYNTLKQTDEWRNWESHLTQEMLNVAREMISKHNM